MYQPVEFQENDRAYASELVKNYPFGVIVGATSSGLGAAHLPFQFVSQGDVKVLEGHGAIRNEWLSSLVDGSEVIVIFSGAHSYITPGVYRAEPDVPTWNYTAVHVRGRYRRLPDTEIRGVLERTVRHNESSEMGSGWSTSSMDAEDLQSLARGVIAFHVDVEDISAGRKLSQDKLQADVDAVEAHLSSCPHGAAREVAADMRAARVIGRSGAPSTDPAVWLGPLGE